MEFLNRPITSERLESKGQSIYKAAKKGIFIGLCGIVFLLLICVICVAMGGDFADPIIFKIDKDFTWAYLFVAIADLSILTGLFSIPTYFFGLIIFALGRISTNTEKK